VAVARRAVRKRGAFGLYRGLGVTLLRSLPQCGVTIKIY
jgi:hypothetical protein